jgi:hypothetical protein
VAAALHDWLPDVIHPVEPWMSDKDIHAGERWSGALAAALEGIHFGIICLTRANLQKPWTMFEAGALAKSVSSAAICPYLIDLTTEAITSSPLSQFQAKCADESGTWELMQAINRSLGQNGRHEDRLRRSFERWWPDLQTNLNALPNDEPSYDDVTSSTIEARNGVLALLIREYMSMNLDPVRAAQFCYELSKLDDKTMAQLRESLSEQSEQKPDFKDLKIPWLGVILGKQ